MNKKKRNAEIQDSIRKEKKDSVRSPTRLTSRQQISSVAGMVGGYNTDCQVTYFLIIGHKVTMIIISEIIMSIFRMRQ